MIRSCIVYAREVSQSGTRSCPRNCVRCRRSGRNSHQLRHKALIPRAGPAWTFRILIFMIPATGLLAARLFPAGLIERCSPLRSAIFLEWSATPAFYEIYAFQNPMLTKVGLCAEIPMAQLPSSLASPNFPLFVPPFSLQLYSCPIGSSSITALVFLLTLIAHQPLVV